MIQESKDKQQMRMIQMTMDKQLDCFLRQALHRQEVKVVLDSC